MISVIIYGRNDSHGYNLHKRAAISLNSLGEVLGDDADEIIFVDYNTPDALPTFLESIGDTLSLKAKRLIRVIRVRPSFHWRCCGQRTHLPVVEPIARNIALRRSTPENRWVLSTNTDMVFVPNARGATLSDICRSLEDGFYQLPRFELPEAIWESFDRLNGPDVIERARIVSRRFHLDEVVPHKMSVYDGPGDFQLALRDDLFNIFGFDEAMIFGWHVDSNLIARMRLKRGAVSSLKEHLRGYHCDHTRLVTVYHAAGAMENDSRIFVNEVSRAQCLNQADNWGYPDELFEEFKLDVDDIFVRYTGAITYVIPKEQEIEYLCPYNEDPFEIQNYPVEHVLPFLFDILSTLPRQVVILYYGVTSSLLERLAAGLPHIIPEARIFVPCGSPCIETVIIDSPIVSVRALSDCLREADLLVFEFAVGNVFSRGSRWEKADRDRLARVERAFLDAVDDEENRLTGDSPMPRRFVAVNAIRNIFESMMQRHLDCSRTPLSSRVRHGVLRRAHAPAGHRKGSDWRAEAIREQMKRYWVPPATELHMLKSLVHTWARSALTDRIEAEALLMNHRTPLAVFADLVQHGPNEHESLKGALSRLPVAEFDALSSHAHDFLPRGGGLLDLNDWEDPEWFRFVRRHMDGLDAADWFSRSPWVWERATILRLLEIHGMLGSRRRVLSCSWEADCLSAFLAQHATVVQARLSLNGSFPLTTPPRSWLDCYDLYDGHRLISWSGEDQDQAPFDAIVAPRHALLSAGARSLRVLLDRLWPLLAPQGVVVFSGLVDISPSRDEGHLVLDDLKQSDGVGWPHLIPGYQLVTPIRLCLSKSSIERRQDLTIAGRLIPRTVEAIKDTVLMKGAFVFVRLTCRDQPET